MADEPGTDSAQSTEPNTNSTSSNGDNEETIENAKQLYIYILEFDVRSSVSKGTILCKYKDVGIIESNIMYIYC